MLAGAYRGEVTFYRELAPTVAVRVPASYHAAITPGTGDFTLLLEDLAPWQQGDQIAGCTVAEARDAVVNLAGLHGPRWCDPALLDVEGLSINGPADASLLAEVYAPAVETFATDLGALLEPADVDVLRRSAEVIEAWALDRAERFALVHGDYRLDNLLFPADGSGGVCAVDWQTLSLALPARDVAYLLSTSLPVDERRGWENALVGEYHEALLGHGVAGYDLEQCLDDYAFSMLQGPLVAVLGCIYGTRTDRGDRMFAAMVNRSCTAIRDLASFERITPPRA
jgi:aminoglycoside/choline kinase family phosphotransferase